MTRKAPFKPEMTGQTLTDTLSKKLKSLTKDGQGGTKQARSRRPTTKCLIPKAFLLCNKDTDDFLLVNAIDLIPCKLTFRLPDEQKLRDTTLRLRLGTGEEHDYQIIHVFEQGKNE